MLVKPYTRFVKTFSLWCFLLFATSSQASDFLTADIPDFSAFSTPKIQQVIDTTVTTTQPVKVDLISEDKGIQPGQSFWIGIKVDLAKDWHTYWKNSGDSGMPTSIEWHLPPGFEVETVEWPSPERFIDKSLVSFGYSAPFVLLAKIAPAKGLSSGLNIEIGATLRWVACNEGNCLPGDSNAKISLPVSKATPLKNSNNRTEFSQAREKIPLSNGVLYLNPEVGAKGNGTAVAIHAPLKEKSIALADSGADVAISTPQEEMPMDFEGGLGLALVMAFLGGMILNLMPCVLPVISLKVLSIVKMSGKHRLANIKHGLVFALGVLVSFWVLAGALLILQAYGHAVGWGFQLQEPIFVAILAAVLLVFALSLFGVFEIGTGLASIAGEAEHQNSKKATGLAGSFFNGILATAVATPCTGPFLGSAIGFAVTLPPIAAMSVFTSLGLGVAFPYILMTSFPSLVKWLPKPGNWMITFKQLMGFLLIATDLWLIWVFGAQTDNFAIFLLLCSFFILSLACWSYGRWCTPYKSRRIRKAGLLSSCLLLLAGTYFLVISAKLVPENKEIALSSHTINGKEDPRAWLPFTPEAVEQLRESGKPVFIDFTAKWCVICQTNHMVLMLEDLEQRFADLGIVKFKADWTRPDPAITKELRKFGRNGVPLYLLYVPGAANPMVLPQVLTPDVVNSYLDKVQGSAKEAKANVNSKTVTAF
ncbi:MAG: hypothetical protein E6Q59_00880 [Nitrosomonas sp.]|nr:MAG: hypothetical protein E6Q59_00880 [Nitrosomonas sp.]